LKALLLAAALCLSTSVAQASSEQNYERLKSIFEYYAPYALAWLKACHASDTYTRYLEALGSAASVFPNIDTYKFVTAAMSNADRESAFLGFIPMGSIGPREPDAEECKENVGNALDTLAKLTALSH
jgi:hypothetical protein